MSRTKFEDDCSDCRPALINPQTGEIAADTEPAMQVVNAVWEGTTRAERVAFHRATCLNSQDTEDMHLMAGIMNRIKAGLDQQRWLGPKFVEYLVSQGLNYNEVERELHALTWREDENIKASDTEHKARGLVGESVTCNAAVVRFDLESQGFPPGSFGYDGAITLISKGAVVRFTRETAEKVFTKAEEKLRSRSGS
jgi:hypothetical protein